MSMGNTNLALAAAVAAAHAATAQPVDAQCKNEKCYGIAQAGENDCAATHNNTCAGTAKMDYDPRAWKLVPTGTCETIEVNLKDGSTRKGSLKAITG
jgi:uncharacterized membrane protein